MEAAVRLDLGRILPGWNGTRAAPGRAVLGVVAGEGVGPEVVAVALDVLAAVAPAGIDVRFAAPVDLRAERDAGRHLPSGIAGFCSSVFEDGGAVLCGPGGGRFVYELRERFDLFCKLTPVNPLAAVRDAGVLRAEARDGVDVIFVRDNTGGLYFGEGGGEHDEDGRLVGAFHHYGYSRAHVDRLVRVAASLAARRRGRLAIVVKHGGVPAMTELWRESAVATAREAGVDVELIDVDNACYQVIAKARAFDVVAAPNMFGDVIADVSALLLGSRGLAFSANFADDGVAVYQTAHGAGYDIAGRDIANPVAQILSLALLLDESFGLREQAAAMRRAVETTLAAGWRTADVMAPGCTLVGTRDLGRRIADACRAPTAIR